MASPDVSGLREQIPGPVHRELARLELLRQLDANEGRLTVLVAPAGYGKTTLLAQQARARPGQVAWVSLREDDADPEVLSRSIVLALRRVAPGLPLPQWVRRQESGGSSEGLALALADDLTASTVSFDIVLDGTEVLQAAAEGWLERWLDALTEGHRVFLAGRAEPGIGLARRAARGDARVLGVADLAFTPEETAACLRDLPPPLEPQAVHTHLDGWPVGVALVASGAAPQLTPADLVADVLGQLPRPLRERLPEASVLEVWTEEGAVQAGLSLAPGWLREVRRAGLPLTPLGRMYRPHQLVRELLDSELRGQGERHTQLHLAAGQGAEQAGDGLRALGHYRAAGAPGEVLRLAEHLAAQYETRGEHRLVRQVLEAVPAGQLPPRLQRLFGHALFETGEAGRGELLLRQLREEGGTDPPLLFSLGVLAARAGESARQLELAEEGLRCASDAKDVRRLLRVKASALLTLGRHVEAGEVARAAADLAHAGNDLVEFGAALAALQLAYRLSGQEEACEAALRRGLEVYEALGMPSRALLLQNDLADLLRERGQETEALDLIARALPVAEREHSVVQALLLETKGDIHFWRGENQAAAAQYRLAVSLCGRFKFDALASRVLPRLVEAALRSGDHPLALEALAWARVVAQSPQEHPDAALRFCEGLWARAQQDWTAAHRLFSQVTGAGLGAAFSSGMRGALYAAEAATELGQFRRPEAERVQAALSTAERRHFCPGDGEVLRRVAAACARVGRPGDAFVRLMPPSVPRPLSLATTLPLHIQSLGAVRVTLTGTPLHLPLSKSAEVLVWLALNGEATRDRIVDALWGGSDERRHVEYFKVAVRHLRLALAAHPAVTFNPLPFEAGVYRLSERFTLDLDAGLARRALVSLAPQDLRRAVEAYSGAFLPAVEAEWAEPVRADVLEATVAAATTLGSQLERTAPGEAVAWYERAIELDPLHEDGHVRLVRLHTSLGHEVAARHASGRYRRMLREEWGREPEEDPGRRFE